MFGRGKASQVEAETAQPSLTHESASSSTASAGETVGKGRPTPKRREAEARNRQPIVSGTGLPANATKEQRRAYKQAQREQRAALREQQRIALMTGDDAHLPVRDKGPVKRWVRDYVDARRSVGEYFLPGTMLVLGLSMVPNLTVKTVAVVLLYSLLIAVIIDSVLLRRTLKRETEARFGEKARGAAGYGMMRALQFRRFRMPKPQVERGNYPK